MSPIPGEHNWQIPTDAEEFFSQQARRQGQEERRPSIRKASDLLGPGLAPFAVPIDDFDSDVAAFNGFFIAEPGANLSPDDTKWWIGQTIADRFNGGWQMFSTFQAADAAGGKHAVMMRSFAVAPDSGERFYSAWQAVGTSALEPRRNLSPYLISGFAGAFDIHTDGIWREIRANLTGTFAANARTNISTAILAEDRPDANAWAGAYLTTNTAGLVVLEKTGIIGVINPNAAAKSTTQFTIIYSVIPA